MPERNRFFLCEVFPYIACTLFETFCVVIWIDVFSIPSGETDMRKSISFLPSSFQAFGTFCKVLQYFWVLPIVEILVILELINPFQFFLTGRLSIVVHIIGLPFCWVFVTVWNQAAVVPILVYFLRAVKELTCCHPVLLIFKPQLQLQK